MQVKGGKVGGVWIRLHNSTRHPTRMRCWRLKMGVKHWEIMSNYAPRKWLYDTKAKRLNGCYVNSEEPYLSQIYNF